jgi:hypothetical protein
MDKFHLSIQMTAEEYLGGTRAGGGVPALAKLLRMREGTLYNQVNPNSEGHCVNVDTFRAMLLATKDYRALDELERDCGRAAFKLPDFSKVGDTALLEICARMTKEYGDIGGKLSEALQSGDISHAEAAGLKKEAIEMIAVITEFVARVEGIAR